MIRQLPKAKCYEISCSHCKDEYLVSFETVDADSCLQWAEENHGFAVVGKFHFCPSCFSNMLERWKTNNMEAINE